MMLNENTVNDKYPDGYEEARRKFSHPFLEMFDDLIVQATPGVGTQILKVILIGFLMEWESKNYRERLYQSLTAIAISNERIKCVDHPKCIHAVKQNVLHLGELSAMPLNALGIISRPQILEDIIEDHKQVTNEQNALKSKLYKLQSNLDMLNKKTAELQSQEQIHPSLQGDIDKISAEIEEIKNKLTQLKTFIDQIKDENYSVDVMNRLLLKKPGTIQVKLVEPFHFSVLTEEKDLPDESVPLSDEDNYLQSLATLKKLLPFIKDSKITVKTADLIQQIEHLKQNNEPVMLLTNVLKNTNFLFEGLMKPHDYQKAAKKTSGYPSPGMKTLGIMMQALGALMVLTGIVIAASGVAVVPGIALGVAGAATIASGFFFNKAKGVSKTLIELSKNVEEQTDSVLSFKL